MCWYEKRHILTKSHYARFHLPRFDAILAVSHGFDFEKFNA